LVTSLFWVELLLNQFAELKFGLSPKFPLSEKVSKSLCFRFPCPPIDSIMRLMTVWRITRKIIRTAIIDIYALCNQQFLQF